MDKKIRCLATAVVVSLLALSLGAQMTSTDNTPSYKFGATIFADYTYVDSPEAIDANGNAYHPAAFNVGRTYINFTGKLNDRISFRITPDITREKSTGSTNGSYVVRLKYGFMQYSLDGRMPKGSWIRFGQQQTPWIDYEEGIYRYRFQGTIFPDREGYLTSSDIGLSGKFMFPNDYGDVHVGYYNGDGYSKPEANNQQAFQVRASVRPFPKSDAMKGLRFAVFHDADNYASSNEKNRTIANVTFQNPRVNAGFDYLTAKDQKDAASPVIDSRGWSAWVTPRSSMGLEGLLRHDELEPDTDSSAKKKRDIFGVAYWVQGMQKVSTAFMVDYEKVSYDNWSTVKPDETRYAVHMLVNF